MPPRLPIGAASRGGTLDAATELPQRTRGKPHLPGKAQVNASVTQHLPAHYLDRLGASQRPEEAGRIAARILQGHPAQFRLQSDVLSCGSAVQSRPVRTSATPKEARNRVHHMQAKPCNGMTLFDCFLVVARPYLLRGTLWNSLRLQQLDDALAAIRPAEGPKPLLE
jgi:hypothetical protein